MSRKIYFSIRFYMVYAVVCLYIISYMFLSKMNLKYIQIDSGILNNFSIIFFYLPILLILIVGHISIYENKLLLCRNQKKLFINIIKTFNVILIIICLSIFLLLSYFNLSEAFHLIINIILIANIFLLICILVNFFTSMQLLKILPIVIYGIEVLLFQLFRKSLFIHYNLPIMYSIPLYIAIIASLFILIMQLSKAVDISV